MNRKTKKGKTKMTKTLKEMIEFVNNEHISTRQRNFFRYYAIEYLREHLSNYKSVVDAWEDFDPSKMYDGADYADCLLHEWARKENPEYCEGMEISMYPVPSDDELEEWRQKR